MKDSEPISDILQHLEDETGVKYDLEKENAEYTHDKNDTEHFVDFIEFLNNSDIISSEDIPYIPFYPQVRYLLNKEPIHQDGHDMIRPVKISDDLFLETNHDSESKIRYTERMIADFILE